MTSKLLKTSGYDLRREFRIDTSIWWRKPKGPGELPKLRLKQRMRGKNKNGNGRRKRRSGKPKRSNLLERERDQNGSSLTKTMAGIE